MSTALPPDSDTAPKPARGRPRLSPATPDAAPAAPLYRRSEEGSDPSFATTLAHGLSVLGSFRPGEAALSNGELSRRTGLSRATVTRLTRTLAELGHVRRDEAGRFRLGTRTLAMAYPLLAGLRIRQLARPLMRDFAADAGGTVSLAMPFGTDFIYVETVRMTESAPHLPDVGFASALAPTAVGRALLSLHSTEEFADFEAAMAAKGPEEWRARKAATLAGMAACREQGFCVSLGEWRPEVYGVAAPIYRTRDGDCLAVNCGIPSFRISPDRVASEFGPRMAGLARAIRNLMPGA